MDVSEIVLNNLGWDITDFGSGNFHACGLFLFTLRNGSSDNWEKLKGKLYAEKLLVVDVDQITPLHFHWKKTEDIINRGGGNLNLQLYNSTPDEKADIESEITIRIDGVQRTLSPGGIVTLNSRRIDHPTTFLLSQILGNGWACIGWGSLNGK